jgi:MoaA/NifB/PqqE/SkfB family radical SAM enzyme
MISEPEKQDQPVLPREVAAALNLLDPLVATVDSDGRLVLPAEVVRGLGLIPGISVTLDREPNGVHLRRPVEQLVKVYVEPTSRCNLDCRTCIRNSWDDPQGDMNEETFSRVLEGLRAFDPMPGVFFGGFGEPLTHPRILDMIAEVVALARASDPRPKVELITNGCLLCEETSKRLIEIGLDTLWVSLDGVRPESYEDVRLGALLPDVLDNLRRFQQLRREIHGVKKSPFDWWEDPRWYFKRGAYTYLTPELGIAFVAMRRNVSDLRELRTLAHELGAALFSVSNLLPYTEDMEKEILYRDSLAVRPIPTAGHRQLGLPRMDIGDLAVLSCWYGGGFVGEHASGMRGSCPFVEAGTVAISWRGNVSPCLPLLHSHTEFLRGSQRQVHRHAVGNAVECDLKDIWSDLAYTAFRRRVQEFDFPPCIECGGCTLSDENKEDCESDVFPRCGACLWSQGFIRCP